MLYEKKRHLWFILRFPTYADEYNHIELVCAHWADRPTIIYFTYVELCKNNTILRKIYQLQIWNPGPCDVKAWCQ